MSKTLLDPFKAATWNVYSGTPVNELVRHLRRLLNDGVSLIYFQEAKHPELRSMLRDHGLTVSYHSPQYAIAYVPAVWKGVAKHGLRLSENPYYTTTGREAYSDAIMSVLRHTSGRSLTAISYHLPPAVQTPQGNVNDGVPNRVQVLRESIKRLSDIAAEATTNACLFGGDDNVDESRGRGWEFMLRAATGLRQVQAPAPTHGHKTRGRKIDDFRCRHLAVGEGEVRPAPGDHRIHVREFGWRR